MAADEPVFFASPAKFRAWLRRHHAKAAAIEVGFHKRHTDTPSLTWPEAVDEALCFGWIDGVRHRIDAERYRIRFTPRRPGSRWSAINIARVEALEKAGRLQPAGRAAFEQRSDRKSRTYSYEQQRASAALDAAAERRFRADAKAWRFFSAQPPSYRRTMAWWVVSAKQEATRSRRLDKLIEASRRGERL